MNDNVVKLDDHRPHQATYVACLACGKDLGGSSPRRDTTLSMSNL
jgi:hypothetical protein